MSDDGIDLVANFAIVGALLNDAHTTGQTLIELKDKEIVQLRAELNLIRDRVSMLCDQPYAPSTSRLLEMIHPSYDSVTAAITRGLGEWNYDH